MNTKFFILILFLIATPFRMFADKDKAVLPPVENSWNDYKADGDRSLSSAPSLLKDANFVYVYSEKQLDNLSIGITDM